MSTLSRLLLQNGRLGPFLPVSTSQAIFRQQQQRRGKASSSSSSSSPSILSQNDLGMVRREKERRERIGRVSEAMLIYLRSVQEEEEVLEGKKREFEQGKRHLANIMGYNQETMTQNQIDASIKYLFPSGLFDTKARPKLRAPDELRPPRRMDVDERGWPRHSLFYTIRPVFYTLLSDISRRTQKLVRAYDHQQLALERGEMKPEEEVKQQQKAYPMKPLGAHQWRISCGEEPLSNEMRAAISMALEYMCQLPNATLERDFLKAFGAKEFGWAKKEEGREGEGEAQTDGEVAKPVIFETKYIKAKIPEPIRAPDGRKQATAHSRVKETQVSATVTAGGSGKLTVDGHHYDEFRDLQAREILLSPLIVCDLLGQVDIAARVLSGPGGKSVIPRAVRHASSLALAALFPELGERLRWAGLLNPELRRRERSKINQTGARAKPIWKKR